MTKRSSGAGPARLSAGDRVAVPIANGRFALIWILDADRDRNLTFLVMDGFWDAVPDVRRVAAARPSKASKEDRLLGYDDVWKGWFRGGVPADFTIVGKRAPSKKEIGYAKNLSGTMVFGTAKRLRDELSSTWRLKHDRRRVESEWAAADAMREKREAKRRKSMTLTKLLRSPLFKRRSARGAPRAAREAQRIFRAATKELIGLAGGTKRDRTKVLKRITTELNALDDRTGWIETVEREQIVARIEELATLVGLSNRGEVLTGHRDW